METVRDIDNIALAALVLKARGPAYNGVETFDIEYEESGPLFVANAAPVTIIKGVRTDSEGREFIILSQKNMAADIVKALNSVVEHLAAQRHFMKGYAPVFPTDSGAFGMAHDYKVFDKHGKPLEDWKNKSGHYRIMFAFDCAVTRDEVLSAAPKIQQLQFVEEMKRTFDQCYWTPPVTIKVRKILVPRKRTATTPAGKPKSKSGLPIAERQVRKPRVHGKVDTHAGLGLDECANFP